MLIAYILIEKMNIYMLLLILNRRVILKLAASAGLVFLLTVLMIGFTTRCSDSEKDLPEILKEAENPYLGETPPDDDPVVFAPGIVSTPDLIEIGIAFSPDGKEIYFSRSAGPEISSDFSIWACREGKKGWETPRVASFSTHRDFAPFMIPDGRRFLFYSQDSSNPEYKEGTYITERTEDSWSQPIFYNDAYCITSSKEGDLYFSGGEENNRDILAFWETDAGFTQPRDLVGGVNTEAYEAHPYISSDGSFILFDSERPSEFEHGGIYVSFRNEDGSWSEALSLGPKINATNSLIPSLSPDGKYIFFSRDNDIWWVSARIIHELRDKIFNN
jgi:Tol biopolymer transport system component